MFACCMSACLHVAWVHVCMSACLHVARVHECMLHVACLHVE
jgi:hypothetical protein